MSTILFKKIDIGKTGKIKKEQLEEYYSKEMRNLDITHRIFRILAKTGKQYIEKDDLYPLARIVMETHPGLEFLKATPEFQDKYADTVVYRIFYSLDRNDKGKITFREFKRGGFKDSLFRLCEDEDINKVIFFSVFMI